MRRIVRGIDFAIARSRLLGVPTLTPSEKRVLQRVSLRTSLRDTMYKALGARHYLGVGLSAMRSISLGYKGEPKTILDLPCGYGRVLRFLRARYPNAEINACEIDPSAVEFCRKEFGAIPLQSNADLDITVYQQFDLIWCGSLVTHLDATRITRLFEFFYDHLTPTGVCIFTSHGTTPYAWMKSGIENYGLSDVSGVVHSYERTGFGYAPYDGQEYGISLISRSKMESMMPGNPSLFIEHGWDNHQDVYAFSRANLEPTEMLAPPIEKIRSGWQAAF